MIYVCFGLSPTVFQKTQKFRKNYILAVSLCFWHKLKDKKKKKSFKKIMFLPLSIHVIQISVCVTLSQNIFEIIAIICFFFNFSKFLTFLCCNNWKCMWSQIFVRLALSLTVSEISANWCFFLIFQYFEILKKNCCDHWSMWSKICLRFTLSLTVSEIIADLNFCGLEICNILKFGNNES